MATKKPYLDKIFNYIVVEKFDSICALTEENHSEFIKNLKSDIKLKYNFSNEEFLKYTYDITEIFKAVVVKHYLDDKYPDKLTELRACKIKSNPSSILKNLKGLPYKGTRYIAYNLRKMIKASTLKTTSTPSVEPNPPHPIDEDITYNNDGVSENPSAESIEPTTTNPLEERNTDNNDDLERELDSSIDSKKNLKSEDIAPNKDVGLNNPDNPPIKPSSDKLNTEIKPDLTLTELKSLIKSGTPKFNELSQLNDANIHEQLTAQFNTQYNITADLIDKYITTVLRNSKKTNIEVKKTIDEIALINQEAADKIIDLKEKLKIATDENLSLQQELENLKNEYNQVIRLSAKYKPKEEKTKDNDIIHFTANDLSHLINNSITNYHVDVKAVLMQKACEYVDALNLIKTKNVISTSQDLYSEIIQVILINLFKENGLF